jgi:spoIIIJ-associated protein
MPTQDNDAFKPIDVQASTLEQAIDDGLKQLGLTRNDVIIEIVEEGSRGVLGMGQRDAIVRLTPLKKPNPPAVQPAPHQPVRQSEPEPQPEPEPEPQPRHEMHQTEPEPEYEDDYEFGENDDFGEEGDYGEEDDYGDEDYPDYDEPEREHYDPSVNGEVAPDAALGAEALMELLAQMNIKADVDINRARPDGAEEDPPWILDIHGSDLGILIGRRGDTLNALQYITRLIVSREIQERANIVVDVEGYKARRESALRKLAQRMATKAKRQGRTITLDPMPPNERRIIHITLRADNDVTTESVGSGNQRKVTIVPTH